MSLENLRGFLYRGLTYNLTNLQESSELIVKCDLNISKLVNDGKGDDILKEISNYSDSYLRFFPNKQYNTNLDVATLALACCSKINKSEQFSHSG